MLHILFLFIFVAVHNVTAIPNCPIQQSCNDTVLPPSEVQSFCDRHQARMSGKRCCNFNDTTIGLDLRYCEIKKLNGSMAAFSDLEILDLRDNDFEKFGSADLVGLMKLEFLYLPEHISCPGGANCWEVTSDLGNMTSCFTQEDPCAALNISCGEPENAFCIHNGPGSAKCKCNPGYTGYKCLVKGEFPVTVFTIGIIVPTIVLSIALWYIQGRDPYRTLQN